MPTRKGKPESAAQWVPMADLVAWDANPRINEHAVADVAASIKRFGFASPIIAREESGEIIAGHTRYKAALSLGLDRVPVRYLALDPTEAHLLALADNRTAEIADWSDGLSDVLRALEEDGADLSGLGWDDDELAAILEAPTIEPFEPDDYEHDDEIPEAPPAITQPGDVIQMGRHTLHCGDCIEVMRALPDDSIDAIVTDPPYGIGFMGKGWDCSVPSDDFAREALRLLKPGGHLVAFCGTRTVHRLAVAIEDAGFEIRDQIGWLQWQGFPKSLDVSKAIDAMHGAEREVEGHRLGTGSKRMCGVDNGKGFGPTVDITAPATDDAKRWQGWGTALKPATEPAILARKPLDGTVAENVLKWGTGALNVDGCRIAPGDPSWPGPSDYDPTSSDGVPRGRWPANIYHCPKPYRGEREEGCEDLAKGNAAIECHGAGAKALNSPRAGTGRTAGGLGNHHPTVKPIRLMRWLVRLVTPPGATVLEPFAGSGTTMIATEREGFACIGIEQDPAYCDIIRARVDAALTD